MERLLKQQILSDLDKKMVFLGGPRQAGKTTLARSLAARSELDYLNWDIDQDRTLILDGKLGSKRFLVLDELHKYSRWRKLLKGYFDSMKVERIPYRRVLVTGSARLDWYRYGGDSLQGRYHYLRLLPLTLREIRGTTNADLTSLFELNGFPEPFLTQSKAEARRWSREYQARIVRDELSSLESLHDAAAVELLLKRVAPTIGGILSINAVREDLGYAHKTIARWVEMLERTYALFTVAPFSSSKLRTVKKERKAYYYDWGPLEDRGARWENLIALHLLKWVYWRQDTLGEDVALNFYRDKMGREVDFVVSVKGVPTHLIEAKLAAGAVSPHLFYLKGRFPQAEAWQVHLHGDASYVAREGVRVAPAAELLRELA